MLAQRLDTLEADLQMLLAMQDLFLQGTEFESNESPQYLGRAVPYPSDVPERDPDALKRSKGKVKSRLKEQTDGNKLQNSTTQVIQPPQMSDLNKLHTISNSNQTGDLNSTWGKEVGKDARSYGLESLSNKLTEEFNQEKLGLQEQIDEEKRLRTEVTESAKKVYVKLQKVEDELFREKQTKESLLLGTLQLKTLVENLNSKIKENDKEVSDYKIQVEQLRLEVEDLTAENSKLLQSVTSLCHELGYQSLDYHQFHHQNRAVTAVDSFINFLRNKFQNLIQSSVNKEHEEVNKLASQLNNVVGRCAKLEKERDDALTELSQFQNRLENLKKQVRESEQSTHSLESEMLKKQIEHECLIQKLQSEIALEKDKAKLKISEYSSVIQRSKALLLSLRSERDETKVKVKEVGALNQELQSKLRSAQEEKNILQNELEQIKRNFYDTKRESSHSIEILRLESEKLQENLKKSETEKRKCMELMNEMKSQLLSLKNKQEHEMAMHHVENSHLKNENKRLDENLRVLQKISEDQGHTVQKLRGELENLKEISFKLETQVRDHECAEKQLYKKLEQSEKQCESYLRQIDSLEEKLEKYVEDVKEHDCEEYVESKYKRKLVELDKEFHCKTKEFEEALQRIESEKDEATQTAKKAVQKIEEMKQLHSNQISQIKTAFQTELTKLLEKQRKLDADKTNKVLGLQSELERVKASSSQIQRALSMKIQQLRAALGICLGEGSNSTQSSGGGSSGLGLLESIQQLNQTNQTPSSWTTPPNVPLSNIGGSNGTAFNNNSVWANVLQNISSSLGGGNNNQTTTGFGGSNSNESEILSTCCEAAFSQTGSLSGDFISSSLV